MATPLPAARSAQLAEQDHELNLLLLGAPQLPENLIGRIPDKNEQCRIDKQLLRISLSPQRDLNPQEHLQRPNRHE